MNFAMMFALALGIDYALFLVVATAPPGWADCRHPRRDRRDDGHRGKAVLLSGLTVLVSLSAVMLVPRPPSGRWPGDHARRRLRAGGDPDAAAGRTGKLDLRINKFALKWVRTGEHRSARFAAWAMGCGATLAVRARGRFILLALAAPVLGLRTAMPSIQVLPEDASARVGYDLVQESFGPGAPGTLQVVARTRQMRGRGGLAGPGHAGGDARAAQPPTTAGWCIQAMPTVRPV